MKKNLLNIFLFLLLVHGSAYALETNEHLASDSFKKHCKKRLKPNRVLVKAINNRHKVDYTKNYKELKSLSSRNINYGNVLGLVSFTFGGKARVVARRYFDKENDLSCITFDLIIEINLKHTLFVASDFLDNRCVFAEIYNHELRHIKANEAQFKKVKSYLQKQAAGAYRKQIYYGDKDYVMELLKTEAMDKWLQVARQKQSEVYWAHKQIDSPESPRILRRQFI